MGLWLYNGWTWTRDRVALWKAFDGSMSVDWSRHHRATEYVVEELRVLEPWYEDLHADAIRTGNVVELRRLHCLERIAIERGNARAQPQVRPGLRGTFEVVVERDSSTGVIIDTLIRQVIEGPLDDADHGGIAHAICRDVDLPTLLREGNDAAPIADSTNTALKHLIDDIVNWGANGQCGGYGGLGRSLEQMYRGHGLCGSMFSFDELLRS